MKDLYGRLEKTQPGAFAAFCAHVAAERTRAERIAARLSERRRQECLATFDTEEYRLTLFARWLATAGRVLAREGPPTAGDAAPDGQTAAVA